MEQFALDNIEKIQVVGVGAQDDFDLALDFLDRTGVATPTMLWDPSFATWQAFGVRANSQMMVLSGDLERGTGLVYGFDSGQQQAILDLVATL
ncbi:MAG: hypothetical protein ACR2P0_09070 [Acidimicrobiales bacterium]